MFKKGQSGNPGGRSAAQRGANAELSRYIGEKTNNGIALVDKLLASIEEPAHTPSAQARRDSNIQFLIERYAGKAPQEVIASVEAITSGPVDLSAMTDDDLAQIELKLAAARAVSAATDN